LLKPLLVLKPLSDTFSCPFIPSDEVRIKRLRVSPNEFVHLETAKNGQQCAIDVCWLDAINRHDYRRDALCEAITIIEGRLTINREEIVRSSLPEHERLTGRGSYRRTPHRRGANLIEKRAPLSGSTQTPPYAFPIVCHAGALELTGAP
jgi:hypothetical protein